MHILCPHCRSPIELVTIRAHEEIACPLCGSSFRLETDSTTGFEQRSGQRLGKFELIDTVGHGAFGTVYMARDPELARTVAIKVPRAGNLAGPQELDRFLREARSVAQLRHPSIVTVHEVGQADGLPYLVSDLVRGITLTDLMSARRLTFREAAELVAGVADALQYAHEQGVIHRDVKPSNIMIGEDGRPAVMDFGLAKRDAGEITMTIEGQVLGTPAYMSPEQARGEGHRVDGRADVYSLGVILYQLVTGELPFRGTQRMLLHQVLHDEPRQPRSLNDRIPRDLETITLKAMAKELARRYASARAFADDLQSWLKGDPIKARPVGRAEKLARWCRRNPALAGATGVAAAALVAVTVVSVLFALQQAGDAERLRDQKSELDRTLTRLVETDTKRTEALAGAARLALSRGFALAEQGETAQGMLWMARGLEIAPNEAGDLQRLIRANLGGWRYHVRELALAVPSLQSGPLELGSGTSAFSGDGKLLVTIVRPNLVQVWDAVTGLPIGKPLDHTDVGSALFAAEGSTVITVAGGPADSPADPMSVRFWDGATGNPITELIPARQVIVSPDRRRIAILRRPAKDDAPATIQARETTTGKPLGSPIELPRLWGDVNFGRAGELLQIQTATALHCINLATGQIAFIWKFPDPEGLKRPSPDGKTVLIEKGDKLRFWNAATSQPIGEQFIVRGGTASTEFNPDGKVLLTHSGGEFRLWDASTGKPIGDPLPPGGGQILLHGDKQFSSDGKHLVTLGKDEMIRFWDPQTGKLLGTPLSHSAEIRRVQFSSDSKKLVTHSIEKDRWQVRVYDATTRKLLAGPLVHVGQVKTAVVSPDGNSLLTYTALQTVHVWDIKSGQALGAAIPHAETISDVYWLPDSSRFVIQSHSGDRFTSGQSGTFRVWRLSVDRQRIGPTLGNQVPAFNALFDSHVAFTGDGKAVDVLGPNGEFRWDAATGKLLNKRELPSDDPARRWCVSGNDRFRLSHREWAMLYLWDTATGEVRTRLGPVPGFEAEFQPTDSQRKVVFSPDGKMIVTRIRSLSGSRNEVRAWDTASGKPLGPALHFKGYPPAVMFIDGGRVLVAEEPENDRGADVNIWDAISGKPVTRSIKLPSIRDFGRLEVSPDGLVAIIQCHESGETGKKVVNLFDLKSGQAIGEPLSASSDWSWLFSPDSRYTLLTTQDGSGQLLETHTGKRLDKQPFLNPSSIALAQRGGAPQPEAAFSADGRFLAVAERNQGVVQLLDLKTFVKHGSALKHLGNVFVLAFRPDGKRLVTLSDDNKLRLWDTTTCQPLGDSSPIGPWTFFPSLAVNERDQVRVIHYNGRFLSYDLATGKSLGSNLEKPPTSVLDPVYSPDNKLVVTATVEHEIEVRDSATDRLLGPPIHVDGARGKTDRHLSPAIHVDGSRADVINLSRDGQKLMSDVFRPGDHPNRSAGREIRLWNTTTGRLIGRPLMHPTAVYCGAISPDGRLVVTGNSQKIGSVGLDLLNDEGGEVRVWDAETGEQLGAAIRLPEPVRAVRFSPGGDSFYTLCYPLLGPPWNSEVRVWDSASRRPRGEPLRMNGQPWHSVTYSADGKLLAVAGLEGITPRIWILDTTTGKSIRPPWTFPVRTLALAFSPDGRILLSGGGHARNSGEARLWDLGTGRLIGKPIVQQEMNTTHVAFSPDGRSFLTWSGYSGQLRHTPQPVEASVERVVLWTQVLTGMELNADGEVKLLDATTWQDRRQLLKLGGPPIP